MIWNKEWSTQHTHHTILEDLSSTHLTVKMQSNRAPWPKRNIVKHCCYRWLEVNIKPVPRCHFVNYNIAEVYYDKFANILLRVPGYRTSFRVEPVLHTDFCKEKCRDTPTKTNAHQTATHLHCILEEIKSAQCTASQLLKFGIVAQLHDCKMHNRIACHLQLHNGL